MASSAQHQDDTSQVVLDRVRELFEAGGAPALATELASDAGAFWLQAVADEPAAVSGATIPATSPRIFLPSSWPFTASRRRWSSVRRSRRPPSCSRRTRFSSIK